MAIDEAAIVEAVSGLGIAGDEEGMIPAFGLYLTRHMADYYDRVSFAAVRAAEGTPLEEDVQALLVEAGHVCAFNTFGGVMESAEFEAVVGPMIERREDWIVGMVAVINTFGWGRWAVEELVPDERLTVSIEGSYEADGWVRDYPRSPAGRCFLARGGVAGLMNLLYVGDIRERPTLDEGYYLRLFRGDDAFSAVEERCHAMGHDRCLLTATRAG